jgi:uncharacterized membrane protein YfcA
MTLVFAGLFLVGAWAGIQNALAGGGTFFTFPVLLLAGLDARAANITSTIALFPGQVATAFAGRSHVTGTADITVRALIGISLFGGIVGAALLLLTPSRYFELLVPFLVLFATGVFAWGSFIRRPSASQVHLGHRGAYAAQFAIAVYGGYFGGGIGILMLAALTAAGMEFRYAGATKNVLAGVMNASAVVLFAFSHDVRWLYALIVAAGSIIGGQIGAWMLLRVNVKLLRIFVVAIGLILSVGLFVRAYDG